MAVDVERVVPCAAGVPAPSDGQESRAEREGGFGGDKCNRAGSLIIRL